MQTLQCFKNFFVCFFVHKKLNKPPSKVAHNRPKPFLPQSSPTHSQQPKINFSYLKNVSTSICSLICEYFLYFGVKFYYYHVFSLALHVSYGCPNHYWTLRCRKVTNHGRKTLKLGIHTNSTQDCIIMHNDFPVNSFTIKIKSIFQQCRSYNIFPCNQTGNISKLINKQCLQTKQIG